MLNHTSHKETAIWGVKQLDVRDDEAAEIFWQPRLRYYNLLQAFHVGPLVESEVNVGRWMEA